MYDWSFLDTQVKKKMEISQEKRKIKSLTYSNSTIGIVTPPVYARMQDTVTAMCDWSPLDPQV